MVQQSSWRLGYIRFKDKARSYLAVLLLQIGLTIFSFHILPSIRINYISSLFPTFHRKVSILNVFQQHFDSVVMYIELLLDNFAITCKID